MFSLHSFLFNKICFKFFFFSFFNEMSFKMTRIYADIVQNPTLPRAFQNFWRTTVYLCILEHYFCSSRFACIQISCYCCALYVWSYISVINRVALQRVPNHSLLRFHFSQDAPLEGMQPMQSKAAQYALEQSLHVIFFER